MHSANSFSKYIAETQEQKLVEDVATMLAFLQKRNGLGNFNPSIAIAIASKYKKSRSLSPKERNLLQNMHARIGLQYAHEYEKSLEEDAADTAGWQHP